MATTHKLDESKLDEPKLDKNEIIVLNLKMLALIQPGDKLYLENDLLKIDKPTIIQGIHRWLNDYSRNKTSDELDLIANTTTKIIDDIISGNNTRDLDTNLICQKILIELNNCNKGIENLKLTYQNDTFINSRLEIIRDKFKECKDKIIKNMSIIDNQ